MTTKTTLMLAVLILHTMTTTPTARAVSLGMYKSCLYECLNCVNTWGKDLFNGEKCAENCAETGGQSIDTTCTAFFTRASRRVSAARQYLHSEDLTGRYRGRLGGGHLGGYLGYRGYRHYRPGPGALVFRTYPQERSRSAVSRECQKLCRTCETRFTAGMDAHSCLYTCVRTKKEVISC